MSTLAHVFEAEGLSTVALGSQRQQLERTAPPRGLWCDFPLGRPLGRLGDAAFQHRVLRHALSLLDAPEPVFDVFPEAIHDDGSDVVACDLPPRDNPGAQPAIDEARGLRHAYDRAVARFGERAGAGRVVDADGVAAALEALLRVVDGTPWKDAGIPGIPARVAQDIRGYYETAALALAEEPPTVYAATRWFFDHTSAGRLVLDARAAMRDSGAKQPIWFYMTPGDR